MNAMTATILVIGGMAALGAVIGAVVSSVFGGGRGGLVGLAALFGLLGAAGGWWMNEHQVQPGLAFQAAAKSADVSPDVLALKRYFPTDYTAMQQELEAAKNDRTGAAGAEYLVRLHVRDVVRRQAKVAGDKEVVTLMALRRDTAKALAAKSPAYCMEYFNGGRLSFDPGAVLPADLLRRDAAVSAGLLQQTATDPVKEAGGAETRSMSYASRLLLYKEVEIRDGVSDKAMSLFPAEDQKTIRLMVTRKSSLRDQPALQTMLCKYKIALLDEALKLPEPQAATVYRMNQGVYF